MVALSSVSTLPDYRSRDADLDTRLPLLVKSPGFDAAEGIENAERIKGNRLANQGRQLLNEGRGLTNRLSDLKLTEATGRADALANFRKARAAGEAGAMSHLDAYPEIKSQMQSALDAMDKSERDKAIVRGLQIAEAAKNVAVLPQGSPERVEVWNAQLDALRDKGAISPAQYDRYYGNPSDLVIEQALAMGQSVEDFIESRQEEPSRPTSWDDLTFDQKQEINEQAREMVEAGISEYDTIAPKEFDKRVRRARKTLLKDIFGDIRDPDRKKKRKKAEIEIDEELETAASDEAGTDLSSIPQAAQDYLRENPDLAPQFDEKYGAGAADAVLNG